MPWAEAAPSEELLANGWSHHAFVKKGEKRPFLRLIKNLTDDASSQFECFLQHPAGQRERASQLLSFATGRSFQSLSRQVLASPKPRTRFLHQPVFDLAAHPLQIAQR